jgi:hypothetical protein
LAPIEEQMVTTSRLVSLDAVGSEGTDLIHLTGSLPVVARTTMGEPPPGVPICSPVPVRVDLRFDATRVRGVSLKTGARYWAEGVHQSRHHPGEISAPFEVTSRFALLGSTLPGAPPRRLTMTVRFRVLVPADGRVSVEALDVELLPDGDIGSSSPGSPERAGGAGR